MSKAFGIAFGAAIVVIGVLVWLGFAKTAGNHLVPTGHIGKVRAVKVTDDVTLVVIDFNIRNDSDRDMIVHSVEASIDTADGGTVMGGSVAGADVKNALTMGEQYNPVLRERDTIPAHQVEDHMVGFRFDTPFEKVDTRKRVILKVEDVTGPVLELTK